MTEQTIELTTTVNGRAWSGAIPVQEVLLDFVRYRLGLTGTKRSCESEVCGACTVLVDDQPVSACTYLAFETRGKQILTVEGLGESNRLSPLQQAFVRNVGMQCGYCTSGQLMAATGLLRANSSPTYDQIATWMAGNICRCGCYQAIAQSILEAAAERAAV